MGSAAEVCTSPDNLVVGRWEKELRQRLKDLGPPAKGSLSDDEFDRVFGEQIEQTLTEYRLMVMELIGIKFWLRGALRTFWALSAVLVVAVGVIAYYAHGADSAAGGNSARLKTLDAQIVRIEEEVRKFNSGNPVYVNEHRRTQRLVCALDPTTAECSKVEGR